MTFTEIKYGVIVVVTSIFAFLEPIANDLLCMLFLFAGNAFFGLVADICEGQKWDKKKFGWAFVEALLFFAFVTLIYVIGYLKDNMLGAVQCVSFISYSLMYFYGTNICRNMMQILPEGTLGHKTFAFIYSVLSVEIVKQIPYLSAYLDKNKNK